MIEKLHQFEKGRRKRSFKFGVIAGVLCVCTIAAVAYGVKKAVKEVIDGEKAAEETEATVCEEETIAEETVPEETAEA